MRGVVDGDREEPAEAVHLAVVRRTRRRGRVGRRRELRDQSREALLGLRGKGRDAVARRRPGLRARLAGRAWRLAAREPAGDAEDAALDGEQMERDLADAPVVVCPGRDVT